MRRIRRPSHTTVVAYIALFLVLSGGTAVALGGANTVFTDDIANDTQPASGGNPAGGLVAADLRPSSVGGSEVANNSLAGVDLAPSALTRGRSITSSCDPTSSTYVDCGTLELNLTRPSRVLIIATAQWYSLGPAGPAESAFTDGLCNIAVNSAVIEPNGRPGEVQNVSDAGAKHSLTLTNMTAPQSLGPGNHTFGLVCNQTNGDIVFNPTNVSVVVLGSA